MLDDGIMNAKENKAIFLMRGSKYIGMFLDREDKEDSLSCTYVILFLFKSDI